VHRPLGEQREDGRADVTAPAPAPSAMATAWSARSEAESETEARSEPGAERAGTEPAASAGLVLQQAPHFTAGFPAGLVHGATTVWIEEAEAETFALRAIVRAIVRVIVRALEWLSHEWVVLRFWSRTQECVPMHQRYIGNYRYATVGSRVMRITVTASHEFDGWMRLPMCPRNAGERKTRKGKRWKRS
jgi:hypothetical protein